MSTFTAFVEREEALVKVALKKGFVEILLDADLSYREGMLDSIYSAKVVGKEGSSYWCDIGLPRPGLLNKEASFPVLQVGEKVLVQVKREAFLDVAEACHHHSQKPVELTRHLVFSHQGCLYFALKNDYMLRSAEPCLPLETQKQQLQTLYKKVQSQFLTCPSPQLLVAGPSVLQRFLRDLPFATPILFSCPLLLVDARTYCQAFRPDLLQGIDLYNSSLFYSEGLDEVWQSCLDKEVRTPHGNLIFETTACVTSIDVNSSLSHRETINSAFIGLIAQHLCWRRISGNVIIDFASLPPSSQGALQKKLANCLKDDRPRWHLYGWSPLGWLELQRAKRRLPLSMILSLAQRFTETK